MSNKRKIIISVIGVAISITLLAISSILAEEKIINPAIAITLTAVSTVLVLIAIFYAAKVDYETGVYECRKCGHTFKPTFKAYILGVHSLTTRHLKCPKCEDKSWCRRKMDQ
jgi:DNA-directed RNA polymerase subunit RPC12/RpoP